MNIPELFGLENTRWWLDIEDKVIVEGGSGEQLSCPPHYSPHRIPNIGPPIADEPCHFHRASWRMTHHIPGCRLLLCPNFDRMAGEYSKETGRRVWWIISRK